MLKEVDPEKYQQIKKNKRNSIPYMLLGDDNGDIVNILENDNDTEEFFIHTLGSILKDLVI
jgi:hypothetical protein